MSNFHTLAATAPVNRVYPCSATCGLKVYMIGGKGGERFLESMDVFDLQTKEWQTHALPGLKASHCQAHCLDGKIYIFGCIDGSAMMDEFDGNVHILDPVTNAFECMVCRVPGFPTDRMFFQVECDAASSSFVSFGGLPGRSRFHEAYEELHTFKSGTERWNVLPGTLPEELHGCGQSAFKNVSAIAHKQMVYVFSAAEQEEQTLDDEQMLVCDFSTGEWGYGNGPTRARYNAGIVGHADKIYIVGGTPIEFLTYPNRLRVSSSLHDKALYKSISTSIVVYDIIAEEWSVLPARLMLGREKATVTVHNGQLFVVGGLTHDAEFNSVPASAVEVVALAPIGAWIPSKHGQYPASFQRAVVAALLCGARTSCLPDDVLFLIFQMFAYDDFGKPPTLEGYRIANGCLSAENTELMTQNRSWQGGA